MMTLGRRNLLPRRLLLVGCAAGLSAAGLWAAGLSLGQERAATRPAPTDAEAAALAAELRAAYGRPPGEWPAATWDDAVPPEVRAELGPLPEIGHPADNPYNVEKADLGWKLFFDPRLSGSGQIACAGCHHPDTGWADGRANSFGHDAQPVGRNAPGLLGVGLKSELMWDGRAASLEDQALIPIAAHDEMRGDAAVVLARLREQAVYRDQFRAAFGDEAATDETITMDRVAKALATFQRTLAGGRSRFDAFLKGKPDALDDAAVRGLHVFRTTGRCLNCHNGPTLSDGLYHDLGLSYYGRELEDLGRHEVTKNPEDVGRFGTPSLRNLARTPPYMHNGLFELPGVLNLYDVGMPTIKRRPGMEDDPLFPAKSPLLKRLDLSDREKADLTTFLESLTEPRLRARPPVVPGLDATGRRTDLDAFRGTTRPAE